MSKNKKYNFIYKTTSKFNGKFYIGIHSTENLDDGYLGSGSKLLSEIKKYGSTQYEREILEYCESREELIKREKLIVTEDLINNWYCLNLIEGGDNYQKGDKLYYNRFDVKKWKEVEYIYILKNNEVKYVINLLLPYYVSIGWELCLDENIIQIVEHKKKVLELRIQPEYCDIIRGNETETILKILLASYIIKGWKRVEISLK